MYISSWQEHTRKTSTGKLIETVQIFLLVFCYIFDDFFTSLVFTSQILIKDFKPNDFNLTTSKCPNSIQVNHQNTLIFNTILNVKFFINMLLYYTIIVCGKVFDYWWQNVSMYWLASLHYANQSITWSIHLIWFGLGYQLSHTFHLIFPKYLICYVYDYITL